MQSDAPFNPFAAPATGDGGAPATGTYQTHSQPYHHYPYFPPPLPPPPPPPPHLQQPYLPPPHVSSHPQQFSPPNYNLYSSNSASPNLNGMPPPPSQQWHTPPTIGLAYSTLPGLSPPQSLPSAPSLASSTNPQAGHFPVLRSPAHNAHSAPEPAANVPQQNDAPHVSDREEGELSEGGPESQPPASQRQAPTGPRNGGQKRDARGKLMKQQPNSKRKDQGQAGIATKSGPSRPGTLHNGSNNATGQSPQATEPSRFGRPPRDSYRPSNGARRRPSPDYATGGNASIGERNTDSGPSHQPLPEAEGITRGYLEHERLKAKVFIRAWHQNGYSFDQLVAEGLDPQILTSLYDELGIGVGINAQSKKPGQLRGGNNGDPAAHAEAVIGTGQASVVSSKRPHGPVETVNLSPRREPPTAENEQGSKGQTDTEEQVAQLKNSAPGTTSKAMIETDCAPRANPLPEKPKSELNSAAISNPLPEKPKHTNHLGTLQSQSPSLEVDGQAGQASKQTQSAPVDRQSYVERLMAAKSKKPSSTAEKPPTSTTKPSTESSAEQSSISLSKQPTVALGKRKGLVPPTSASEAMASEESPAVKSNAARSVSPSTPNASEVAAAAAKKKALNELARKRMEALTSARLKAAQNNANDDSEVPLSTALEEQAPKPSEAAPTITSSSGDGGPVQDQSHPHPTSPTSSASDSGSGPDETDEAEPPFKPVPGSEEVPTIPQIQSRIPGLFMAAPELAADKGIHMALKSSGSSSHPSPRPTLAFSSAPANARKRPVASDFNDDVLYQPSPKRPFGNPPGIEEDEEMIIEASDDEAVPGEEAYPQKPPVTGQPDDDEAASTMLSTPMDSSHSAVSRGHAASNIGLHERNDSNGGHGQQSTQRNVERRDQDYLKHQKEILAMKLKIAKLEQKRRVKAQSHQNSTLSTPKPEAQADVVANPDLDDGATEIANDSSASVELISGQSPAAERHTSAQSLSKVDPLLQPAASPVSSPVRDNTNSGAVLNEMSNQTIDWKNRRRTEIQSGLPALEESFANDTKQLELLRIQMQKLEEDMKRKQEDKARLIQELESLGIDTDGMAHSTLQAAKDELTAQMETDQNAKDASDGAQKAIDDEYSDNSSEGSSASNMSISSAEEDISDGDRIPPGESGGTVTEDNGQNPQNEPAPNETDDYVDAWDLPTRESNATSAKDTGSEPIYSETPSDSDDAGKSAEATTHGQHAVTQHVETSEAHAERDPAPFTDYELSDDDEEEEEDNQDKSEGEIAESESGKSSLQPEITPNSARELKATDNHESPPSLNPPANQEGTAPGLDDENDDYEPMDVASDSEHDEAASSSGAESDASGEYEPPDAHAVDEDGNLGQLEEGNNEYDPDEDFISASGPPTAQPSHPTSTGDTRPRLSEGVYDPKVADDLAAEIQPQRATSLQDSHSSADDLATDLPQGDRFTPYSSALKSFKAFRFHPNFADTVSDGFRSTTFTHNIDPLLPWCAFEGAGGICNDEKCQAQHFRSMLMKDDDMVHQVGMSNPGQTAEEQSSFTDGLRSLLVELKQGNINDPEAVASEIASYRRRFVKDPTRVL